MTGFTFRYPVFRGWGIQLQKKSDDVCAAEIEPPSDARFMGERPSIKVLIARGVTPKVAAPKKNPGQVPYEYFYTENYLWTQEPLEPADHAGYHLHKLYFYGPSYSVCIELRSLNEENGFSAKAFFEEIIRSFVRP
jgi:hypothetical protein